MNERATTCVSSIRTRRGPATARPGPLRGGTPGLPPRGRRSHVSQTVVCDTCWIDVPSPRPGSWPPSRRAGLSARATRWRVRQGISRIGVDELDLVRLEKTHGAGLPGAVVPFGRGRGRATETGAPAGTATREAPRRRSERAGDRPHKRPCGGAGRLGAADGGRSMTAT